MYKGVDYVEPHLLMCMNAKWCQNKEGWQQHKQETAETSTVNDKAEPENDQSSEPKSKLPKLNFQGYILFALPKIKETKSMHLSLVAQTTGLQH